MQTFAYHNICVLQASFFTEFSVAIKDSEFLLGFLKCVCVCVLERGTVPLSKTHLPTLLNTQPYLYLCCGPKRRYSVAGIGKTKSKSSLCVFLTGIFFSFQMQFIQGTKALTDFCFLESYPLFFNF